MKIWKRLTSPPLRLPKWELHLILVPALFWIIAHQSRSVLLESRCQIDEDICRVENLPSIDQFVVPLRSEFADFMSFAFQNSVAVFGVLLPALVQIRRKMKFKISVHEAAREATTDMLQIGQTILWNGALMETARVWFQRPRPFVFLDWQAQDNPSHYTSFYSGHTSFVAGMMTISFFIWLSRNLKSNRLSQILFASMGLVVTGATGACRVLNARHFVTDVGAAAVMGFLVALTIAFIHRVPKGSDSDE